MATKRKKKRKSVLGKELVYHPPGSTRFQRSEREADAWQKHREFYQTHDVSGRKILPRDD